MKKPETLGTCRFCEAPLAHTFVDLGMSPLCQGHVRPDQLSLMTVFYPLRAYVCDNCFLVQLEECVSPSAIYHNYAYSFSYSDSWLRHAKQYADQVTTKFRINKNNLVAELASNDGYLLQYFVEKGIPVLGIEPAANIAAIAVTEKGVRTESRFFGSETARELIGKYGKADLLIGNNVLAHVADIKDFVSGMKLFLSDFGVITMEFPHLLRLVERNQFDMIYHEHFLYFSFTTVQRIFRHCGLDIFDVEEIQTHGGSIRVYAKHIDDNSKDFSSRVNELLKREREAGVITLDFYNNFDSRVQNCKRKILEFLIRAKLDGKKIVGYGAPGKGNTLLNYCGIRTDFIDYTVDRNPHKQGNYLPGSLIPIYAPDKIKETKPNYVFILPWNLKEEIMDTMSFIQEWGGKFVVPIPEVKVCDPQWFVHRFRKAS
jgi:hypothetical protein